MNFFHEYALLIAVATPVAVIVGINLALYFAGEGETLLLPGIREFPPAGADLNSDTTPEATSAAPAVAPANDADERLAA